MLNTNNYINLNTNQYNDVYTLLSDYLNKSLKWWMPNYKGLSNELKDDLYKVLEYNKNNYDLYWKIIEAIDIEYINYKQASILNATIGIVDEYFEIINSKSSLRKDTIDEFGDLLYYIAMLCKELYETNGIDILVEAYKTSFNVIYLNSRNGYNTNTCLQELLAYSKKSIFHKKQYDTNSEEFKENLIILFADILFDNIYVYLSDKNPSDPEVIKNILFTLLTEVCEFNIKKLEDRQGVKRVNEPGYLTI